jgi:hypothetical protein
MDGAYRNYFSVIAGPPRSGVTRQSMMKCRLDCRKVGMGRNASWMRGSSPRMTVFVVGITGII